MKAKTTKQFIEKAKQVHGNKYDYSKVEYVNNRTKVCIICPIHGEFWQTPNDHLDGCGCKKCFNERVRGKSKLISQNDFLIRAKKIHGDKYDYSKVEYKNIITKVCIICPEHGEFWQTPNDHLNGKRNCPKCAHRSYKKTTEEFINEAKELHGNKYDYSKVEYDGKEKNVCIICPKHGEFLQKPTVHLKGSGCPICNREKNKLKLTTEEFIEKAIKIHGNKYDYSKVEYNNTDDKVCIICPEHGEFWQTPHCHIGKKQGCLFCNESHLEIEIKEFLIKNNIKFEEQKTFDWLRYKKPLRLDFYLPEYNIAIECQGEQHFNKFRWEKNDEKLNERKKRDNIKLDLCKKNGIILKLYSFKKFNENIITDKNKLLCA